MLSYFSFFVKDTSLKLLSSSYSNLSLGYQSLISILSISFKIFKSSFAGFCDVTVSLHKGHLYLISLYKFFSHIEHIKGIFFLHFLHSVKYRLLILSLIFFSILLKASSIFKRSMCLIVNLVISVAEGTKSQIITFLLYFNASIAVTPLPPKGSNIISFSEV